MPHLSFFRGGCRLDARDDRDFTYTLEKRVTPPEFVDLVAQAYYPTGPFTLNIRNERLDQQNIGSCVANAAAQAFAFRQKMETPSDLWLPSRLLIYWEARAKEGTDPTDDAGCQIRTAMKVLRKVGACPETLWPYITKRFSVKPPKVAYEAAEHHASLTYYRLPQDEYHLRACLAEGYPFVIGISVYSDFMSGRVGAGGAVHLPRHGEAFLGRHAILIIGWNSKRRMFKFRNSWGYDWGDNGDGYVPLDYLLNRDLAADAWTLRDVEGNGQRARAAAPATA
jgi:C1A family cysteine protease